MNTLRVVSISNELAQSAEGNELPYKKVGFENRLKDGNEEVLSNSKMRYRNLWPERELPTGDIIAADPLYARIKVGSLVAGTIETQVTSPYTLEDRTLNTYTCIVFDNENKVTVANRNLKANGASVVDTATGLVTGAARNLDVPEIDGEEEEEEVKKTSTPKTNTSKVGAGPKSKVK